MSLKDTKIIIKEDGSSYDAKKKKKKEEEKKEKEKAVSVIKTDTPTSSNKTLKEVLKENEGNNVSRLSQTDAKHSDNDVGRALVSRRAVSINPTTRETAKRQFTYDDYLNSSAARMVEDMLNEYFRTGNHPSSLTSDDLTRLSDTGVRTTVSNNATVTSSTDDWRNPRTFRVIPDEAYNALSKEDKKAYLKSGKEYAVLLQQQREADAYAQTQKQKEEDSRKMLTDHFYKRLLKGDQIDMSNFDSRIVNNIEQKVLDDYTSGNISLEQYRNVLRSNPERLDIEQQRVYNEEKKNTSVPEVNSQNSTPIRYGYSEDTYWDQLLGENGAIYVVDYGDYGLDIVGHAYVLLKDSDGQWIKTEFTGSSKKDAKVYSNKISPSKIIETLSVEPKSFQYIGGMQDSSLFSDFSKKEFKNAYYDGIKFFPIKGDFSRSIDSVNDKYKGTDYGGYNLVNNNCLHYIKEILSYGVAEEDYVNFLINTSTIIAPDSFYEELERRKKTGR